MDIKFLFRVLEKKLLEIYSGDVYTTLCIYLMQLYT